MYTSLFACFRDLLSVVLPCLFAQDELMLSGEEAKWRVLKDALQRLEGLKAESRIL